MKISTGAAVAGRRGKGVAVRGAERSGNREQSDAVAHVVGVQAPALVLDCSGERTERAPAGNVGRSKRGLRLTRPDEEAVQIVQPPEQFLRGLQRRDCGGQPPASALVQ